MASLFSQCMAVIIMNLGSLSRRLWMSLAMVIASAVVVAILLAFLAMAKGFETTVESAGSEDVAFFMRKGSAAELNSSASLEQVNLIRNAPGIARNGDDPLVSPELYVIVDGMKRTTNTEANIPLRGVEQHAFAVRKQFNIIQGRSFTPGTDELIVGQGVINQFSGFELGSEVRFGKYSWQVVGIFDAGGSVFESELWADARVIQSLYNRGNSYQTVRAKLLPGASIDAIKNYMESEPRLNQEVQTESDYFASQSKSLNYMAIFGKVVSSVMALGALAGALNTMYTSVADRAREIATLRAIGFSGTSAFIGTLTEAVILAMLGGVVGALCAFLLFDGLSASTLGGANFSQVVFAFTLTPELLWQGAQMALFIGVISGAFPAWRAARMPVAVAFQTVK